ncbi:hypothetical protein C8R43DRAFT_1139018 [Mycena crocata]|nr:hypothetical protein C8R43DRAFT_1139018 [Mycena crocata]
MASADVETSVRKAGANRIHNPAVKHPFCFFPAHSILAVPRSSPPPPRSCLRRSPPVRLFEQHPTDFDFELDKTPGSGFPVPIIRADIRGFCVALILCGVSALQGYLYFTRYNDKWGVRLLAAMMLLLDFISMALICQSMYYYMRSQAGIFVPRDLPAWTFALGRVHGNVEQCAQALLDIGCPQRHSELLDYSQMYFVYQLHMVKSAGVTGRVMSGVVVLLKMVRLTDGVVLISVIYTPFIHLLCARLPVPAPPSRPFSNDPSLCFLTPHSLESGAVGCVGMMFSVPHMIFTNRNHTFAILAGVAKGFGAAADIVATVAMCLFLRGAGTGISRTSSLLRSLMHLVINRGILVTAAQILLLITFFATSGHLYWLAVHINTTKLYVDTFFGMLNARTALADRYATGHMPLSAETATATAGGNSCPASPYSGSFPTTLNSPYAPYAPGSPGSGHYGKNGNGIGVKGDNRRSVGFREKAGDLETQEYALGAIHVTTSSTVAVF